MRATTCNTTWWAIFAVGAALRLAGLGASAVWYDEAFTWSAARLPLFETVRVAALDYPGPLLYLIEWPFVHLLPRSEIALRTPPLLAGLLSLWLARRLAETLRLRPGVILIGSGLLAVLPYQLWMAQDARFYAFLQALVLAAALWGLTGRWSGLAAITGLLLYLHPIAPFYILPVALLVLWRRPGDYLRLGASLLAGAVAWLPWLPVFLEQNGRDFWLPPFEIGDLWFSLHINWFVRTLPFWWEWDALFLLPLTIALALAVTLWRRPPGQMAIGWLALGPLLLMVMVSAVYRNVIFYRPTSAVTAPMAFWLASAVLDLPGRWPRFALGAWAPVVLLAVAGWNPASKGAALRHYADMIRAEWRPGDVAYHATATSLLPFQFYLDDLPAYGLDFEPHDVLLATTVQNAVGIRRASLNNLTWGRAWLIWARDPWLDNLASRRMDGYLARYDGQYRGRITYWQAATIEIYLLERENDVTAR